MTHKDSLQKIICKYEGKRGEKDKDVYRAFWKKEEKGEIMEIFS